MGFTAFLAKFFANYRDSTSAGSRFRAKRVLPLIDIIRATFCEFGCVNLIDIGGRREYWSIIPFDILVECNVRITILNVKINDDSCEDAVFSYVEGDACDLSIFSDGFFHVAHSNSVIEHVGDWGRMVSFARECRRVSHYYFVQSPNFWFPIEPHSMVPFFHWLPEPWRVRLVQRFQLGHWARASSVDAAVEIVQSARLLDRSMFVSLFPDARVICENFLFMRKSFVALRCAAIDRG